MKKTSTLLLISLLILQTLAAQGDSAAYERRPFQFTFLFPPLSTNGAGNSRIINDVSLNLFLGVSGGVEAFEAAGFINVDQYYMNGVQVAGFGNTVGGAVSGAQLAGFYNVNGGPVQGFQGAGFVNVAGATKKAAQVAGFGNVAGGGKTHFQGAGFFNVAEEVNGAQLAGFLNVAGKVKGFQGAGFLNICDSIDGVPLAFISVVRKNGYRRIGFTASEVQYASLSLKMGVNRLYTIYSFGKPFGPGSRWMYGAGLGTEMELSEKMMLNIEGTVQQELWVGNQASPYFLHMDRLNLYNSIKFLFGWNLDNKLDLHIGPTFNVSVAHTNPDLGQMAWNEIAPYSFFSFTGSSYKQSNVQMWFGLQGSIHFSAIP